MEYYEEPPVKRGWLLPYLLRGDEIFLKRWDYWLRIIDGRKLIDEPIPQIEFASSGIRELEKTAAGENILACLNRFQGQWREELFVDWLLYGFGARGYGDKWPDKVSKEMHEWWYKKFEIGRLQEKPADYMVILADRIHSETNRKRTGYFPTPMNIAKMMNLMVMQDGDWRNKSVMEPCVGTGIFLLHASNYSLCLYGIDIDPIMCKLTIINGFLYIPWLVAIPPYPIDGLSELDKHPPIRNANALTLGLREQLASGDDRESAGKVASVPLHKKRQIGLDFG